MALMFLKVKIFVFSYCWTIGLWLIFLYNWAYFRDALDYNNLYYMAQSLSIVDFYTYFRVVLGWFDPAYSLFIYTGSNIFGHFSFDPFIFYSIVPALLNIKLAQRFFDNRDLRLFWFLPLLCLCSFVFYNLILAFELRRLALSIVILFFSYPTRNKFQIAGIFLSLLIHPQVFVFSLPMLYEAIVNNYSFSWSRLQVHFKKISLLYLSVFPAFIAFLSSTPFFATVYSKLVYYTSLSSLTIPLLSGLLIVVLVLLIKGSTPYYLSIILLSISLIAFGSDRVNILIYYLPFLYYPILRSRVKPLKKIHVLIIFLILGLIKTYLDFHIDPCNMNYSNLTCPLELP